MLEVLFISFFAQHPVVWCRGSSIFWLTMRQAELVFFCIMQGQFWSMNKLSVCLCGTVQPSLFACWSAAQSRRDTDRSGQAALLGQHWEYREYAHWWISTGDRMTLDKQNVSTGRIWRKQKFAWIKMVTTLQPHKHKCLKKTKIRKDNFSEFLNSIVENYVGDYDPDRLERRRASDIGRSIAKNRQMQQLSRHTRAVWDIANDKKEQKLSYKKQTQQSLDSTYSSTWYSIDKSERSTYSIWTETMQNIFISWWTSKQKDIERQVTCMINSVLLHSDQYLNSSDLHRRINTLEIRTRDSALNRRNTLKLNVTHEKQWSDGTLTKRGSGRTNTTETNCEVWGDSEPANAMIKH